MPQFESAGASVVAVCPQLQPFNAAIAEQLKLTFPVFHDRNNALATDFGLTLATPSEVVEAEKSLGLNLPEQNGTSHWDLPIPSRFVLDRSNKVLYRSYNLDHRTRRHPCEALACLSGEP